MDDSEANRQNILYIKQEENETKEEQAAESHKAKLKDKYHKKAYELKTVTSSQHSTKGKPSTPSVTSILLNEWGVSESI